LSIINKIIQTNDKFIQNGIAPIKNKPAKDLSYWYVNFEERKISNSILISSTEINIVKKYL
jgi:hypothetical protein